MENYIHICLFEASRLWKLKSTFDSPTFDEKKKEKKKSIIVFVLLFIEKLKKKNIKKLFFRHLQRKKIYIFYFIIFYYLWKITYKCTFLHLYSHLFIKKMIFFLIFSNFKIFFTCKHKKSSLYLLTILKNSRVCFIK